MIDRLIDRLIDCCVLVSCRVVPCQVVLDPRHCSIEALTYRDSPKAAELSVPVAVLNGKVVHKLTGEEWLPPRAGTTQARRPDLTRPEMCVPRLCDGALRAGRVQAQRGRRDPGPVLRDAAGHRGERPHRGGPQKLDVAALSGYPLHTTPPYPHHTTWVPCMYVCVCMCMCVCVCGRTSAARRPRRSR